MNTLLPLTTFEQFLLWEDRPAYPWSCFVRLKFSGRLDQPTIEAVLPELMQRHPLLRSKLVEQRGKFYWQLLETAVPEVRWIEGTPQDAYPPARHFDLRDEIGLRLYVVRDEASTDLVVQWHHACCDGAGAFVFVNDLLIAYAMQQGVSGRRIQAPQFDQQRIEQRGKYGLTAWKILKMIPRQLIGLQGARQFMQRSPASLIAHQAQADDAPLPEGYPATVVHRFTRDESLALKGVAKDAGVTTNDLFARDIFLGMGTWRQAQGIEDDSWLRMMVPMNLRSSSDRQLSAANVVSSVFLDRRAPDFADSETLLRSIQDEMQLIKNNNLGLTFIFSLGLFRMIPGGMERNSRQDKCTVSCIFTNVGKPLVRCPLPKQDGLLVVGDLVLQQMDGLAPLRPYNCATFGALNYANRWSLTLHYDPRALTAEQAADLHASVIEQFQKTIAGRGG